MLAQQNEINAREVVQQNADTHLPFSAHHKIRKHVKSQRQHAVLAGFFLATPPKNVQSTAPSAQFSLAYADIP